MKYVKIMTGTFFGLDITDRESVPFITDNVRTSGNNSLNLRLVINRFQKGLQGIHESAQYGPMPKF